MNSERLKFFREQKGITQQELSVVVGVRELQINRWENDKAQPSAKNIEKLAAALGVPVSDFDDEAQSVKVSERHISAQTLPVFVSALQGQECTAVLVTRNSGALLVVKYASDGAFDVVTGGFDLSVVAECVRRKLIKLVYNADLDVMNRLRQVSVSLAELNAVIDNALLVSQHPVYKQLLNANESLVTFENEDEKTLIEAYRNLQPHLQSALLLYVDALAHPVLNDGELIKEVS